MNQMAVHVPVLTFSGNEHSRTSSALGLESFTDYAIDERKESKATKSKFKTEVEEIYLLTNC